MKWTEQIGSEYDAFVFNNIIHNNSIYAVLPNNTVVIIILFWLNPSKPIGQCYKIH